MIDNYIQRDYHYAEQSHASENGESKFIREFDIIKLTFQTR